MKIYAKSTGRTRLYCPVSFDPCKVLPMHDRRYADGMVYLCHAIIMHQVFDEMAFNTIKDEVFTDFNIRYRR